MRHKLFLTRDRLVGAYSLPFELNVPDVKDAVEIFRRAIVQQPSKNFQFQDSELYYCGEYDDEAPAFDLLAKPDFLADLGQFFPRREDEKEATDNG